MKIDEKKAKKHAWNETGIFDDVSIIQSMMRSKTLTIMVIVGIIFFVSLFYFLLNCV